MKMKTIFNHHLENKAGCFLGATTEGVLWPTHTCSHTHKNGNSTQVIIKKTAEQNTSFDGSIGQSNCEKHLLL